MGIRAAAYVRKFSLERGDDVPSAEEQRRRIVTYIEEQGWELGGVYEEVGPSELDGWPALQGVLADLESLDKIVLVAFERLPHSARRMANLLNRFEEAGVAIVALDERFDTDAGRGHAVREVLEIVARWSPVDAQPGNGWAPENLRRPGIEPSTVIDVGVASGTGGLYEAFPDAYLVLIEPLEEFRDVLGVLAARHGGEYLLTAVGAAEGTATINIHRTQSLSSLLTGIRAEQSAGRREVPVTTLDKLVAERGWRAPFGLKLDVEGYEPFVIEGAKSMLKETQFVIAELSISPRFEGDLMIGGFIDLMRSHGFKVVDIVDGTRLYADVYFQSDASA
jgi:FkbM family methyltransferase